LNNINDTIIAIVVNITTIIRKDILLPAFLMKLPSGISDFYAGYSTYPVGIAE
jgi:hypothetical protein